MARKAKNLGTGKRRPTQIKAWRKHRGLSLEKLSERLMVEREYEVSPGQLSRVERGEQPYSQDLLEAIAMVLGCAPEDLLWRDPDQRAADFYALYEQLSPVQRVQVEEIAKTLKRTGTDG